MKFVVKENISLEDFVLEEQKIRDTHKEIKDLQESWKSLDGFFRFQSVSQDRKYWWTYFRMYVDLTWKLLSTFKEEEFISIFDRQFVMAIVLDFDVFKELILFLGNNKVDQKQLASLYTKVKSSFFDSVQTAGIWQGKEVLVRDLALEYSALKKRKASSVEEAEFLSKLKQIMYPKEVEPYILVDKDVGLNRFLEVVELFQEIDVDRIWFFVDMFLNPENYRNQPGVANNNSEEVSSSNFEGEEEMDQNPEMQNSVVEEVEVGSPEQTLPVESKDGLVTEKIKSEIESEFKKDSEGNFENIEGVMGRLSELAEDSNDPSIAEMIYFDEEENKFKWKE